MYGLAEECRASFSGWFRASSGWLPRRAAKLPSCCEVAGDVIVPRIPTMERTLRPPTGPDARPVDRSPRAPHRRRRAFGLFVAITITLATAEGVGRMVMGNLGLPAMQLHPADGRCVGLLPNSATDYTGWALRLQQPVVHDVNSQGDRGPEKPRAKPAGWSCILFVADSVTSGRGG